MRLVAIRPVEPVSSGTQATTIVRRAGVWDDDADGSPYFLSMGAPLWLGKVRISGEIGPVEGLTIEQPCEEQGPRRRSPRG